jgi:NADPH:quinone reductase-like Zn-dependent oxidoreductase
MGTSSLQLRSSISDDCRLKINLEEVEIPDPGQEEVLVRVEATPLNPSDLALLFGPADLETIQVGGSAERPEVSAEIPERFMKLVQPRIGQSLPVGNEGSGTVVAAGSSDAAQALLGKKVGMVGGEMYAQYRTVHVFQCLELKEEHTAAQGASCFVNPLTSLAMVETMRNEGYKALVHTAAASNLGQMLNRICQAEGIDLVNIVRKESQEQLLRDMGAKYIVNSSADSFYADLTAALIDTGATLAFDATGGGKMANDILTCMEAAVSRDMTEYNRYGSDVHKQVYIYGGLDRTPTTLNRTYGFAWSVSGFLLTPFLQKIGIERAMQLRQRVADELTTTFASHYTKEVSLAEALSAEAISVYGKQATGEKYLINPQR